MGTHEAFRNLCEQITVSILLESPASGDCRAVLSAVAYCCLSVSILLESPASGDHADITRVSRAGPWFPFFWSPQRVGTSLRSVNSRWPNRVSILLESPASGDPSIVNPYHTGILEAVCEGGAGLY